MNTRPLNEQESRNLAALNQADLNSVLLFVTETGLRKSILDATEEMRSLLRDAQIHDFTNQSPGPKNKILKTALLLSECTMESVSVSLYRPITKQGDPRFWFYGFKRFATPNDVCAIFIHDQTIHVVNLTHSGLAESLAREIDSPVTTYIRRIRGSVPRFR